ncbi:MAG: hypothetical protein D6744_03040 [Planctomycetota bacterium]|nr:MAG: hypothetical protein D6744_03040 [Planctomycetota bacterium]
MAFEQVPELLLDIPALHSLALTTRVFGIRRLSELRDMARPGDAVRASDDSACAILRRSASVGALTMLAVTAIAAVRPALAQCNASLIEHYGGDATLVARSGGRTYAVFGDELSILESSSPAAPPVEHGTLLVAGDHFYDLDASGSYAYIAARNSGLIVVDATDPNAPFVAGTLGFSQDPHLVAYANNHVYLCQRYTSNVDVFIVDVSTPSSPTLVGTYSPVSGYVAAIVVDGSELYVSTDAGVQIVDVSNPAAPAFITTYYFGIAFLDLDVSGGVLAGVRRDSNFVDIADVSNPAAPTAQSIIAASNLSRVALNNAGDRLFVGDISTVIYDLSNLTSPTAHGSISGGSRDYFSANSRILIATGSSLEQWNASDIDAPVNEWTIQKLKSGTDLAANTERLALVGGIVPVQELRLFDISEPGAAVELPGVLLGVDPPEAVAINGDYAFVVTDSDLHVIDLAAPGGAAEIGSAPVSTYVTAVAASDSFALVGEVGSVVEVFDISNPANPIARGSVDLDPNSSPLSGSVTKIVIQGTFAAVSTFSDTFIVSFANPDSPQNEYAFHVVDPPVDIAVRPGLLCVVNNDQLRVDLYDLSSPPIPTYVGSFDETILTPSKIALDDEFLVVFDDSLQFSEVIVVDVSNPAAPIAIGRTASNPYCESLTITGDRIWRLGGADPTGIGDTGIWELGRPGFGVVVPPSDVATCDENLVTFSVTAPGSPAYQWRKDGVDLSNGFTGNGSLIAGANAATLSIFSAGVADEGEYDCVLTNSCGTSTTPPATLSICLNDLDCDGVIGLGDLALLLSDFDCTGGGCAGDVDGDGDTDLADLAQLLAVFDAGCN